MHRYPAPPQASAVANRDAEPARGRCRADLDAHAAQHLLRFEQIRESHLLDALSTLQLSNSALPELARFLRKASGLYDQAARAASSF